MKIEKIRELGAEELRGKASELLEEVFRARMQKETGQLDQSVKLKSLRRDLARVKTVLREIGLAEARAARESEG
ncbi:MAG TPA: 50S ribosomal protein L29 [Vicinamibacteria bacterium]|nr:50S ribosomal protein L29 [Vicinamibacteria bacterium]